MIKLKQQKNIEKDLEITISLCNRLKEENTRLTEKLKVKPHKKNTMDSFFFFCRLKLFEVMKKNINYNQLKKKINIYVKQSLN